MGKDWNFYTKNKEHTSPDANLAKIQPRDQRLTFWSYGRLRMTLGAL
jgi:hypothetical protein